MTFGLAAMAGAYAGGRIAHVVPGTALLVLFGIVMVVAATLMLMSGRTTEAAEPHALRLGRALPLGAAVGVMSAPALRRGFAWLVVAMGLFVFVKQLPSSLAVLATVLTLLAIWFVSRPAPLAPPAS